MGVACDIFIPKDLQEKNNNILLGNSPFEQTHSPDWLKIINNTFSSSLIKKTNHCLSVLNDRDLLTFEEIADILEMVYILKVLD